jgi:cyclophilin family peptidyl-prolyl cis-trans isomerase
MRPNAYRLLAVSSLLVAVGACATAAPPPGPPPVTFEQKIAWLLQLEDRRVLKIELPPPPAIAPPGRGRRAAAPPPAPSSSPDAFVLIKDPEPRVRRRAALAIGRVGLADGIPPLAAALSDPDPDVRQMAAFAMGLLGVAHDAGNGQLAPALGPAVPPLTAALADADILVRGRAAEALGQLGARDTAPAIGKLAADLARSAPVAALQPDDEQWPGPPEAAAFRLAVFALVRLRAYEPLAGAVLGADGRPVSTWWPVAYALQRINDTRAQPALVQLLGVPGKYTRSFAARGLGALRSRDAVAALLPLLDASRVPLEVVVSAIRAAGQIGDERAAAPLVALAAEPSVHPNIRLEAVTALGQLRTSEAVAVLQDRMTDPWPAMRSAALRAAAVADQENFLIVLSGLDADGEWQVRAALADVLAGLPAETALPRLREMLKDQDKRVLPSVMGALVRLKAPEAGEVVLRMLKEPDFAVRAAAARLVGQLKPAGGAEALREALTAAQPDSAYDARAAALAALAEYGASEVETIRAGLADKDWAVRVRTIDLLARLDAGAARRAAIRPVPNAPVVPYDDPQLVAPAYSPHVFIETAKGTIEFELAVLDAPQTARNFMALARRGFFNGLRIHRVVPNFVVQDGDSRGDGEGGPGYTIRDELNDRPYVRGTVGMALAWRDTGGSQFFITHSPQPHLDGRYTVFGHVVNGMDVVDRIQQGDAIQRVRVWDGKGWQ